MSGTSLVLLFLGLIAADPPKSIIYEVEAGKYERRDVAIFAPLPKGWESTDGLALEDLDTHQFNPVQLAAPRIDRPYNACWIVRAPIAAGKSRRYRLSITDHIFPEPPHGGVHAIVDGKSDQPVPLGPKSRTMTLKVGDRPVLTYHAAIVQPPPGIDPLYARGGFLHPLQTPSGAIVTDDFPPDHAHQHGVFFAWVNTTFEGRKVDFWNQKEKTGRVGPDDSGNTEVLRGPVFGELRASLIHEDITTATAPKPVLHESWLILVYNLEGVFIVDFQSTQFIELHALTINKYHYGGFGLRGNRQWLDPTVTGDAAPAPAKSGNSDFLTSDGKHRADGNHTRPRWVDLSGRVDGKFAGVTVLDHPSNFRFPQPVRLHPNKPYFCFAPMVDDAFTLNVGKPYVSRYRLLLHDGPPDLDAIERAWHDYAEPPQVRMVAD